MKKVKTKNGILWFYLIDAVLLVVLFLALIPFKDKNSPEQKTTTLLNPNYKEKVAAVKISTPLENGKRTSVTIVKRGDFICSETEDSRIIEIPALIDENGKIICGALDKLKKEDYE